MMGKNQGKDVSKVVIKRGLYTEVAKGYRKLSKVIRKFSRK